MKKTPSTKSSCALLAGALTAAAFVVAPSSASAQIQLAITAFEADRIELSFSGTLSGQGPFIANSLSIQGPGGVLGGGALTFSGAQPLTGMTLSSSNALSSGGLASRINLTFGNNLESGVTQGSGATFTLTAASPVFDPTAVLIPQLRLHWGFNSETSQPFGVFQSNAIVPEPSAYAALIGLAALGCVARRRQR